MFIMAAGALCFSAAAHAARESGGTVIDVTTGLPVEGAYVMNVYREAGASFLAHSSSWCVRTQGMYTAKDGKFRFPLEKSKYLYLEVIKPGYTQTRAPEVKWKRTLTGTVRVPDPNLYLKPQDPAKPEYSRYMYCERAYWKRDVAALLEFYKLQLEELQIYGDHDDSIKHLEGRIGQLETHTTD
jgi:hypothetical protein